MADNSRRVYTTPDGVEYPRVGTILPQPDLQKWAAGQGAEAVIRFLADHPGANRDDALAWAKSNWKSSDAMDLGTEAHQLIDDEISGKTPSIVARDGALFAYEAWEKWSKSNVESYVAHECSLISTLRGFGGTFDALAKMKDGRSMILDWKTGSDFYDNYSLAMAGYRLLAREHGYTVDGAMCVLLPKEPGGTVETKDYTENLDRYEVAFLGHVMAYYNHKKRQLKNNPMVEEIWGKRNGKETV